MSASFTCGHRVEITVGAFGRGKAREKRLAEYFNRPCLECAVEKAAYSISKSVFIDGTPIPLSKKLELINKEGNRLEKKYLSNMR